MTNASKVKVTGRKAEQVVYRRHTMYPGGLKEIPYREMMRKKPDEVCWSFVLVCMTAGDGEGGEGHQDGGVGDAAQEQVA